MKPASPQKLAIYGLWHLGCTLCGVWSKLGHQVVGIDPDPILVKNLQEGRAPVYEPDLDELLQESVRQGRLSFSTDATAAASASIVFIAYDTEVDDQDCSHLGTIEKALDALAAHLLPSAIVVLSAQLPVGAARRLRSRIQEINPGVEVAYSPENLRLGEALACYLRPGHIVVGVEKEEALSRLKDLFEPMDAQIIGVNLPTAEMTKHGINSFLAASISMTNQLADLCDVSGADVSAVIRAMRLDPRIGTRAYLTPGLGFSGGTLGRDLRVLESVSKSAGDCAPLFGSIWEWNQSRYAYVRKALEKALGTLKGRTVAILGLTYKPGTSTLRRSLPLRIALDLKEAGAALQVYDPKANYKESDATRGFTICGSAKEAAAAADAIVVLTAWPEFKELGWKEISSLMRTAVLLDPASFLQESHPEKAGFDYIALGRGTNS